MAAKDATRLAIGGYKRNDCGSLLGQMSSIGLNLLMLEPLVI